ncbi:MAG TPA: nucleoside/nucleotide kinase family protein [Streptosporangiaceae bacterium]
MSGVEEEARPLLAGVPGPGVPAAELVSVSKAFGPTPALSDVSLALRPGEVLALPGGDPARDQDRPPCPGHQHRKRPVEPQEHVRKAHAAQTVRSGEPPMRPPSSVLAEVPQRLELSLAQLAARARSLIRPGRRVILGITGAPGAGKSTVAGALQRAMTGTAAVVGMDGFHLAQDELVRLGRQDRKGAPDTFDPHGYAALLRRLKDERDPFVYAPVFRRDLEDPIANHLRIDRATPLVITEGNYLLLDEEGWTLARQQLDEVWFLDLPDEIRRHRLILRHQEFGKDPETARRRAAGSDQDNADIVRATQDAANLIVTVIDEQPIGA